ncbi:energy transducer TonB [Winogradskyella pacifica]|uniref:energy transducer TonB n=1 Tax=Winogradskyella pacifica TaxID=664642 RepID=UPI0015CDDC58|nr:energy transducer TonB [Winogradskyella pacifica]
MKKNIAYIIILLFLTIGSSYSQSKNKNIPKPKMPDSYGTCEYGTERAKKDANNGIYKSLSYGLIVRFDWEFHKFYAEHIKSKYGITVGDGGCLVSSESECYSTTMKELIYKKFGNNIFDKAKQESIELYKSTEKYKNEIKPKIDSDFVFTSTQENAQFSGGRDSLNTYFKDKIKNMKDFKGTVRASFIIEKNGEITNVEILQSLNEKANNEVIRIIKEMPNWKPAIHFGEAVRVKRTRIVRFK